jgi:hypothetical protein
MQVSFEERQCFKMAVERTVNRATDELSCKDTSAVTQLYFGKFIWGRNMTVARSRVNARPCGYAA